MHNTHETHKTRGTLSLVLAALAIGLFSLTAPTLPAFAADADADDDPPASAAPAEEAQDADDAQETDDAQDADEAEDGSASPQPAGNEESNNTQPVKTEKIQGFRGPDSVTIAELDENGPFPAGPENTAHARHFVGTSYLTPVSNGQVRISSVTFEAGCRSNWHVHTARSGGGLILIATAGRGYYQIRGRAPVEMHPGDVVHIPANVRYWYGAAPNTAFQHLALAVPGEDAGTKWEEAVDAEEYDKLQ